VIRESRRALRLFLLKEEFETAERHSADDIYFWVTIRTKSGIFQLQDLSSI
jgi:hypothetical protein